MSSHIDDLLNRLSREPDLTADNLLPYDATDRLLLDQTAADVAASDPGTVATIGDAHGALTLGAIALGARDVRVWQDALVSEQALAANAERLGVSGYQTIGLTPEAFDGVRVVLMQLPRSLDQLRDLITLIASGASPDVQLVAGGRVKHMTLAMNDVLRERFREVQPSLARQKSRLLHASGLVAEPGTPVHPAQAEIDAGHGIQPLTVRAFGGAFAGANLDIGTRALLPHVVTAAQNVGTAQHPVAIDLGSGTGLIATVLARANPALRVIATDQMQTAAASTAATVAANAVDERVTVRRDVLLASQPDSSADLVVCNPPFHVGSTVHTGVALEMFADAARVLRPGGALLTVFNSPLGYLPRLRGIVGPTRVLDQNRKFTVALTTRRAGSGEETRR